MQPICKLCAASAPSDAQTARTRRVKVMHTAEKINELMGGSVNTMTENERLFMLIRQKAENLPTFDRRLLIAEIRHLSRMGTYKDVRGRGGAVVRLWWN